jgi:hypothetical protein
MRKLDVSAGFMLRKLYRFAAEPQFQTIVWPELSADFMKTADAMLPARAVNIKPENARAVLGGLP